MQDRREEILAGACRIISRRGVERVRMADVAREVGVSAALVHYYFSTRSELLRAAFVYADERVLLFERHVAETYPALEGLKLLLLSYLDQQGDIFENWVLWREMASHCLTETELRPAFVESYRLWVRLLADLIRRGQSDGTIASRIDADEAAWRLSAMVEVLESHLLLDILPKRECVFLLLGGMKRELQPVAE